MPQHWETDDSPGSKGKVSGLLAEQRTREYDGEVCKHGPEPSQGWEAPPSLSLLYSY